MSALTQLYEKHRCSADIPQAQKATVDDLVKFIELKDITPDEVSLKELFDITVRPQIAKNGKHFDQMSSLSSIHEELSSSVFPYATRKLIAPYIMEQYEVDTADVMKLVTETTSNKPEEDIVGMSDSDGPKYVPEGYPYPSSQMAEKRVKIVNHKFGNDIDLTKEMILYDQTGQLVQRARDEATFMGEIIERGICYRLADTTWTDLEGHDPGAFIYGGTASTVYSTDHSAIDGQTNSNLGTAGAPSWTTTNELGQKLSGMKSIKGKPVRARMTTIVGHTNMAEEFARFYGHQEYELNSGERNVNTFKGRFQIVTSQFMPSSTHWFAGDPKRQLIFQWNWKPTVTDEMGDYKRDIALVFKVSTKFGIGHRDYRFITKNAYAG